MKIAILGSGEVGKALGRGFAAAGHDVMMGSRDPAAEKVTAWVAEAGSHASAGTGAEAAAWCDLAVLATPWSGTQEGIALAGADHLAEKVVIDVTNPLDFNGGAPRLSLGHDDSAGEQVQRWLPGSKVVKAFNIIGSGDMVNPQFPGGPPDMFICGNDDSAKQTVTELLAAFGWPTIDIGGIEGSRLLEPLAMLWITVGVRSGQWGHAFKLLRR